MEQIVGDDERGEPEAADRDCQADRSQQCNARSEQAEPDGRDKICCHVSGRDRPSRALARIDAAIEVIVEIHAPDIEQRHRHQHDAGSSALPRTTGEHRSGEDVGPHRRQV